MGNLGLGSTCVSPTPTPGKVQPVVIECGLFSYKNHLSWFTLHTIAWLIFLQHSSENITLLLRITKNS